VLLELRLENYAVIDNAVVEFATGLNLLTGETGAGKSILIDALALLLGEKASTDVIRHDCQRAVMTGVFEANGRDGKRALNVLEANGIDCNEDEVIIRREISASGKGRVFINNQPATVGVLRQLSPHLATIHAQNESLSSFDAATRLELLDTFAGSQLSDAAEAYARWKEIRQHIAELQRDEQDRLRLLDLWKFQKQEIESAHAEAEEDERLESEKRVLANAEKIYAAAMGAYEFLYGGTNSAAALLRAGARQLEELARYDGRFQELLAALESARITAEDAGSTLRDYAGGIQASPERLAEVEDRLALLDRLKRKYGPSLSEVVAFGEELNRKLNGVENKDEVLGQLRRELDRAAATYLSIARALSEKRRESARKLQKLVEQQINELAMKAQFRIDVTNSEQESDWASTGFDQVLFLISTNFGDPPKPLEQVASGGELSRVMLALKTSIENGVSGSAGRRRSGSGLQRTMVFDEIDTGIGGKAAEAVGRKLKELARAAQVLCITHLPQIAAFADHHYLIQKKEVGGRTRTTVRKLEGEQRTEEVARMLSGARLTEASRKNAEQMLRVNA
jgi:DNA repair protein RecN (Recombination protein N)